MVRERPNRSTRKSNYKSKNSSINSSKNSSNRVKYHPRRKYKNTFNYPMIAAAVASVIFILIIIIWIISAVMAAVKPKKITESTKSAGERDYYEKLCLGYEGYF